MDFTTNAKYFIRKLLIMSSVSPRANIQNIGGRTLKPVGGGEILLQAGNLASSCRGGGARGGGTLDLPTWGWRYL